MGENPIEFADVNVTPCPCTKEFYDSMKLHSQILKDEAEKGPYPYSHKRILAWRQDERKKAKVSRKKRREIPLTQSRIDAYG